MSDVFDVVEKDFSGKVIRVIAEGKTMRNAEAIVDMAVVRRGVEESFFVAVPADRDDRDEYAREDAIERGEMDP